VARSLLGAGAFSLYPFRAVIHHPWYLAGIMIVWAQDVNLFVILNNIMISGYFIIGSFLEERKMLRRFSGRVTAITSGTFRCSSPITG